MNEEEVLKLWPELTWISDLQLRKQVADAWALALQRSPLTIADLQAIPFTLLLKDSKTTFKEHKRYVVHIARNSTIAIHELMGSSFSLDMDVIIAGAIMADAGKLLELRGWT